MSHGLLLGKLLKNHGLCRANSLCKYDNILEFIDSCNESEFGFVKLSHVEFYGYDKGYLRFSTLKGCEEECLKLGDYKGFQFKSDEENKATGHGYLQAATGLRRYTYCELERATNGFSEEVGRGGTRIVYKGVLPDHRIAAIKHLHEAGQGEAEFPTESVLEWILHRDITRQNTLLDSNFQPKVANFGLSKLLNRGGLNSSGFSSIRGTRGYVAPEWVYNFPITSKVDVFSYGIVVMEMVTGESLTGAQIVDNNGDQVVKHGRLVPWLREKVIGAASRETWIEEVAGPMLAYDSDIDKMKLLVKMSLRCVEENMDARPTMR
ncbi:hypothetical protein SLEP1_g16701 [Rubroshorea leprosula]|uniref:Protein kinase domain-containing protein n=1 Tax=Rubroshorea leprosula TaxID=152421 RepID=A0AAV5IRS0_9ROSI|nr:hypothetical protein SLEP1_g16701 [Rubroshorea leprosula]